MARPSAAGSEQTFRVVMTGAQGETRLDAQLAAGLARLLRVTELDARELISSMPCDVAVSASGSTARRLQLALQQLGIDSQLEAESPPPPARPSLGASLRAGAPPPWQPEPAGPRFSTGVISHGARPAPRRYVGAERRPAMDASMFLKFLLVAGALAAVVWLRDPRITGETGQGGSETFPYRTRALSPGAESGVPLIIGLHGNGDTTAGFDEALFEGFEAGARIALLQAPTSYTAGRWGGKAWPHLPKDVRPVGTAVHAAALALADKYDAPCRPIVVGFSGGGGMAYYLAANYAKSFSTILPISGWLPEKLIPEAIDHSGQMPVVRALHGENDVVIHHQQGAETVTALSNRGLPITLESFPGNHLAVFQTQRQRVHALLLEAVARCSGYPR